MEFIPALSNALLLTLGIALSAAVPGALLGILLQNGMEQKKGTGYFFSNAYILVFKSIPIILQLFLIYYGLPMISRSLIIPGRLLPTLLVLLLNAAAAFPGVFKALDLQTASRIPAYGLAFLGVFRKTIVYSSLASLFALSELTYIAQRVSQHESNNWTIVAAIAIYLFLGVGLWLLQEFLKKRYFGKPALEVPSLQDAK